jgi:hypothetical protein
VACLRADLGLLRESLASAWGLLVRHTDGDILKRILKPERCPG